MKRRLSLIGLAAALLLMMLSPAMAQDDEQDDSACSSLVDEAITRVDSACAELGRNEICYGNFQIDATLSEDEAAMFEATGDVIPIGAVSSLTLSPLDLESGTWGIALMKARANLPETSPGQNVTFLLFGDVQVTDASEAFDGYEPMQAIYFSAGVGASACQEAPNGLLIQTPEGAADVQINVNGIDVSLGSTAYLTFEASGEAEDAPVNLAFDLLEGSSTLSSGDSEQVLGPGERVMVELDEDLNAIGEIPEPEPIDPDALPLLPVALLERQEGLFGIDAGIAGGVVPLTGNYTLTELEIGAVGSGCPPGIEAFLNPGDLPDTSGFLDFSQGFSAETLRAALEADGAPLPNVTYNEVEPGVVELVFSDQGGTVVLRYTAVDERTITQYLEIGVPDLACTITATGTLSYQD